MTSEKRITRWDQLISSFGNFLLPLVLITATDISTFGKLSVGVTVIVFFLGLSRAAIGEVLLLAIPRTEVVSLNVTRAINIGLRLGILGSSVVLVAFLLVERMTLMNWLIWFLFILATPIIVIQDVVRYELIRESKSYLALVSDAIAMIFSIIGLAASAIVHAPIEVSLSIWILGCVLALVYQLGHKDTFFGENALKTWISDELSTIKSFAFEYLLVNLANLIVWFLLSYLVSSSALGVFRAGLLLFSPLNPIVALLPLTLMARLKNSAEKSERRMLLIELYALPISSALVLAGTSYYFLPLIGSSLMGDSWKAVATILLPVTVQHIMLAIYAAQIVELRARGSYMFTLSVRKIYAIAILVTSVTFGLGFGLQGVAWSFALTAAISAISARIYLTKIHFASKSEAMKPDLLVVNLRMEPGGVTMATLDIAKHYSKSHPVKVVSLAPGSWDSRFIEANVDFEVVSLYKLARYAWSSRVISIHHRLPALILWALGVGNKSVEHLHNYFKNFRFLSFRSKAIVAVSKDIASHTKKIYKHIKNLHVVENGVNSEFEPLAYGSRSKLILAVGRLDDQKNPLAFLDFVAPLFKFDSELKAVWIGEGPLAVEFDQQLEVRNLARKVHRISFMPRNECLEFMNQARIVVSTSRWEGFSLVALEALNLGTPIAVTDCGDIFNLVEEQKVGMQLVQIPLPDREGQNLIHLISDEHRWNEYSRRAKNVADQKYSLATMAKKLTRVFQTLDSKWGDVKK